MVNSRVSREDLDTEMTVVRNEFEMGENNPGAVLFERMQQLAFAWHNYGKSTIGARADIEHVPIDKLQAFYRKYYQPDNAVLHRRRHVRRGAGARAGGEALRADPEADAHAAELYTAGADAGRRARR